MTSSLVFVLQVFTAKCMLQTEELHQLVLPCLYIGITLESFQKHATPDKFNQVALKALLVILTCGQQSGRSLWHMR